MSILIHPFYKEATASSGGIQFSTEYMRGLLKQVIVKAATTSTIFDFSLSDGSSLALLEREAIDGELNETLDMPVQSALQVNISNSTRNELFKIYLTVREK